MIVYFHKSAYRIQYNERNKRSGKMHRQTQTEVKHTNMKEKYNITT